MVYGIVDTFLTLRAPGFLEDLRACSGPNPSEQLPLRQRAGLSRSPWPSPLGTSCAPWVPDEDHEDVLAQGSSQLSRVPEIKNSPHTPRNCFCRRSTYAFPRGVWHTWCPLKPKRTNRRTVCKQMSPKQPFSQGQGLKNGWLLGASLFLNGRVCA